MQFVDGTHKEKQQVTSSKVLILEEGRRRESGLKLATGTKKDTYSISKKCKIKHRCPLSGLQGSIVLRDTLVFSQSKNRKGRMGTLSDPDKQGSCPGPNSRGLCFCPSLSAPQHVQQGICGIMDMYAQRWCTSYRPHSKYQDPEFPAQTFLSPISEPVCALSQSILLRTDQSARLQHRDSLQQSTAKMRAEDGLGWL